MIRAMGFERVCHLDDLWEGEKALFDVAGTPVLLLGLDGGEVRAVQAMCPHQDIPLIEGDFDGDMLMCRAHQWMFDAATGDGINPDHCRLAMYPVNVADDVVYVDTDGVTPLHFAA